MNNKVKLVLKDGTIFEGQAAGYKKSVAGEVVFATGMVGYEQSLTDPSYAGQILTFTYPLIGNWGVPSKEYWESDKIQAQAVIISDLTTKPSHHLSTQTLNEWLLSEKIPAIVGIDTRKLTQKLREKGVMLGKIVFESNDIDFWDPNETNLVAKVSINELRVHYPNSKTEILNPKQISISNDQNSKKIGNWKENVAHGQMEIGNSHNIGLLNCGAKKNILNNLLKRGITVYELPWNYDPFANNLPIDGLVISNGPGDPKTAKQSIAIIKKSLSKKIPTFGVCLGNQLLALAAGGNTYKLKFGHRAQNQPTIQVEDTEQSRSIGTKKCFITTQNHGFAVDEKNLPAGFKRWFFNANDNTNEGIIHEKLPFFSVQFHPEASPGPTDTEFLFDFFIEKFK